MDILPGVSRNLLGPSHMSAFYYFLLVYAISGFIWDVGAVSGSLGPTKSILDTMLEDYDIDRWPTLQDGEMEREVPHPTRVMIWMDIMAISSIDVQAMDLTIDFYLNQQWVDERLKYDETMSRRKIVLRTVEQIRRIWTPDTYMVNAKSANFHEVTTPNRLVYISHDGEVMYSARITAKLSCEMFFAMYPVDTQICDLHLASYAYNLTDLMYVWKKTEPVMYQGSRDLNQFTLSKNWTSDKPDVYPDGQFPALQIMFMFRRNFGHHLIQTYLPTVLIVTISWVSFFLEAGAVPARVSLGITTFLTMITLNSGAKVGLPPVSYVKAIDIWMLACTFFVFSTLWHFVLVCIMSRRPMPSSYRPSASGPSTKQSISAPTGPLHSATASPHLKPAQKLTPYVDPDDAQTDPNMLNANAPSSPETNNISGILKHRSDSAISEPIWVLRAELMAKAAQIAANATELEELTPNAGSPVSAVVPRKKRLCHCRCSCLTAPSNPKDRAKRIDVLARWGYPLIFFLFNIVYWGYYLTMNPVPLKYQDVISGVYD